MGKTISVLHSFVWCYVKYTNIKGFAETVTYSIITILAGPQPSQGATPSISGVYSSNPAVVAEYGMFVNIIILTTVNYVNNQYMCTYVYASYRKSPKLSHGNISHAYF